MDFIFVFLLSFKILFFIAIMKFLYTNIPFVPPIFTTYVEDFYLRRYPELRTPFENKGKELYKYFYKTGIKEGQGASPAFDVKYYLNNNNDLKNVLGSNNYTAAYEHFMEYGKHEGRDLSPVFHLGYYIENNPDVATIFGNHTDGIIDHFIRYGIHEGRSSSPNFNLEAYKSRNEDLKSIFSDNNIEYYYHYCIYGRIEGRSALFDNN